MYTQKIEMAYIWKNMYTHNKYIHAWLVDNGTTGRIVRILVSYEVAGEALDYFFLFLP